MPIKDFEIGKLFIGNEEIGFQSLGELEEIELNENCEISEDIWDLNISDLYEFTAEIQLPQRMTDTEIGCI